MDQNENQVSQAPESEAAVLEKQHASLDRMLNVLTHADWPRVHDYFREYGDRFRIEMENSGKWDEFVAARALRMFVQHVVLRLPEIVQVAKQELESDLALMRAESPTIYAPEAFADDDAEEDGVD